MPIARTSRRTLLLGASALALAACAPAPVQIQSPTASPTGTTRQQLDALMQVYGRNTDLLGVAVKDLRSGALFDYRADYDSQSASIAKVMIVLMALRKARDAGEELTFEQYGLASQAIIVSDNDAADALWEWAGGPEEYTRLAEDLGLPDTHADDRRDFWSWTNTTPSDQRMLIDLLVNGTPVIHDEDRLYLLDIMRKTTPEQSWGVGNPRSSEVLVAMKNGWVQFESTDGLWAVNSIGHVDGEGRDYVAAFMSRVPTFDEGRTLLDAIGADLFEVMGGEPLA